MTKLLVVVVLYRMKPETSPAFQSLLHAMSVRRASGAAVPSILVWDNTPGGQSADVPPDVRYVACPHNPGLATAYNAACAIAAETGCEWLLTLDQDTVLPVDFFRWLDCCLQRVASFPDVAAVVPLIVDGNRIISPYRLRLGAFPGWMPAGYLGTPVEATYATNSGSVIRVSALRTVGGYDPLFPLDLSDIYLFHKLYLAGFKVHVDGSLRLEHELALLDKKDRMSPDRYRAGLLDECAFYDMHLSPLARLERVVRLALRACKDSSKPELSVFRSITMSEVLRRLFTSRKKRLAEWRRWAEARLALGAESASHDGVAGT